MPSAGTWIHGWISNSIDHVMEVPQSVGIDKISILNCWNTIVGSCTHNMRASISFPTMQSTVDAHDHNAIWQAFERAGLVMDIWSQ